MARTMGELRQPKRGAFTIPGCVVALALVLALLAVACSRAEGLSEGISTSSTAMAAQFYEQRIQRDPADFFSYTSLAGAYAQRGRETGDVAYYDLAEKALRRSLEILPAPNYSATVQLAGVLNTKHLFTQALPLAQQAIAARPDAASAYGALSDATLALGRYDEAQSAFRTMEDLQPGLGAYSRLARWYQMTGDLRTAESYWWLAHLNASGDSPELSAWTHVQLGNLYSDQGKQQDARRQFERALEEFPGYVHALAGLGKVSAAERQYSKAISSYQQAIERVPLPEYVIALGDVYVATGRQAEADRQYALVHAIDRLYQASGVNTDLQMALFSADHGDPRDAVARAEAARAARPDVYSADVLAWALYQSGQYDAALPFSQEALHLGTKDPLMLFHAGMVSYKLGRDGEARAYLQQVADLNTRFSVRYSEIAQRTLEALERSRP